GFRYHARRFENQWSGPPPRHAWPGSELRAKRDGILMPYVQQRTWLPLAPRIPGLSLRESPYGFGMGDAPCPSPEQAAGIVDCNDPCQAPYGACAASQIGL